MGAANLIGSPLTRPRSTAPPALTKWSFQKRGTSDYQQFVTIEGGKTTTVNAQLSAAKGEVAVTTTPPGLDVLIDGKLIGPSPVRVTVVAGSHKYTVRRPGWEPYEGTFTVSSGAVVSVRVNMGG